MRKHRLLIELFIGILLIIFSSLIGFKLGLKIDNRVNFYCNIANINDNTLSVDGISENDFNHRGSFVVTIDSKTKITNANGENLESSDLKIGNSIEITYDGQVLETYPPQIKNVYTIMVI